MKIYVASSWRNNIQPTIVKIVRDMKHEVYDFKNPSEGDHGFHWSEIDPTWKTWNSGEFKAALNHELAKKYFAQDMKALIQANATLLVMPCGRSAHLELGVAVGRGQRTAIYMPQNDPAEPELMYKMAGNILTSFEEVSSWAKSLHNIG